MSVHENDFWNYKKEYMEKMEFARDNGCNTLMITGECEPQQNRRFLVELGEMNKALHSPFKNIQMQTTGRDINKGYMRFLKNDIGVRVLSISISSFLPTENKKICGMIDPTNLIYLCMWGREAGLTIRLSINCLDRTLDSLIEYTDFGGSFGINTFFELIKRTFDPDQITLRKMYHNNDGSKISEWVKKHSMGDKTFDNLNKYIKEHGNFLNKLEYGYSRYSVHGMSTVVDDDCMAKERKEELKYLILRPDCKLYTKWDDKGSILF